MKRKDINEELKRFNAINKYGNKLVIEQEQPIPEPSPDSEAELPGAESMPTEPEIPSDDEMASVTGGTENAEVSAEDSELDDTTEEIDITDLVNMTKSIKKQLDDQPKDDINVTQKMDDVFNKLNDLEVKLGEMDSILNRIEELGGKIEEMKPKTPVEQLQMRSLDSYPFNQKPDEFFAGKQQEMKKTGKNEYVLTKGDVENYTRNDIMKSFNPKAEENDYNF